MARYKLGIYMSYSLICFFAGLSGLPSAPGSFRPGLPADPLCFCDRKPSNPRPAFFINADIIDTP